MKKLISFITAAALLTGSICYAGEQTVLIDTNNSSLMQTTSLSAEKSEIYDCNIAAKWEFKYNGIRITDVPKDISNYKTISFNVKSKDAVPCKFIFMVESENTSTAGIDYYSCEISINHTGWQRINIPIKRLSVSRTPRGLNDIDSIMLYSSGWSLNNDLENTCLYMSNFTLQTDEQPENISTSDYSEKTISDGFTFDFSNAFSKTLSAACDLNEVGTIAFTANASDDCTIAIQAISENDSTEGNDYYLKYINLQKGNHSYSFSPKEMVESNKPLGLSTVNKIIMYSKGFGLENPTASVSFSPISASVTKPAPYKEQSDYVNANTQDAVCVKLNSGHALVNGSRRSMGGDAVLINGSTYIPAAFMAESLGFTIDYDMQNKFITISGDNKTISLKENDFVFAGSQGGAENLDKLYLPLRFVSESLGKNVLYNETGFIMISDSEKALTSEKNLSELIKIMQSFTYDRPTGEKMYEDLLKTAPSHPRVLMQSSDFDRMRSLYKTNSTYKLWADKIITRANNYINSYKSRYIVYAVDEGGRLKNSIEDFAITLALAYQLTKDSKYPDALYRQLDYVCTQWPHWHPGHFLNASSMMIGVSIAYDWCYEYWSDEQKAVIEAGLYDYGLQDGIGAYEGTSENIQSPQFGLWHRSTWCKQGNNWNAVCNAGILMSAVALATVPEYTQEAIKCFSYNTDSFILGLTCYAPDGGYAESPGYWSYGTSHVVLLINCLDTAMGTDYGFFDAPGLDETGYFPVYMESRQGMFNYHDCGAGQADTSQSFWFARKLGDKNLGAVRYNELKQGVKSASWKDIVWFDESMASDSSSLEYDKLFTAIDTLTMRSKWNSSSALFAGLHGGSNTVNHCNLDTGTFILDALGQRFFMDLGSEYYNLPNYWNTGTGGKRWNYYRQRAEGQNTLVINPSASEDQVVKSNSKITRFESAKDGCVAELDFTPAYSNYASSAKRGMFMANGRSTVILQDEVKLKSAGEIYWFAHTKASIDISSDGKVAVLTLGGQQLMCRLVSDDDSLKFTQMDATPLATSPTYGQTIKGEYSRAGIRKLVIHAENVTDFNAAVQFIPMTDSDSSEQYYYDYMPMSGWSADFCSADTKLTGIYHDGVLIDGFSPEIYNYELEVPYNSEQVPEITASAESNFSISYENNSSQTLPKTVVITVSDSEGRFKKYKVNIYKTPEIKVSASGYQIGNPPEQTIDGDLSTRWSCEGESWIQYDFREAKTLSKMQIAFWKSAERKARFDILVSENGEDFTTVFSGISSNNADTLADFEFGKAYTLKSVKLVCRGNTAENNEWNSILEVCF